MGGTRFLDIPDGVTVTCKARHVTVTGPRGKLERSFKHVQLDMRMVSPQKLRVDLWFGTRKQVAGRTVEIRNFLGDKKVRRIPLLDGVEYTRTADVKDQIELTGNDVGAVSLTASQIRQSCNITKKDLRKFLDGIFVSWKGPTPEPV